MDNNIGLRQIRTVLFGILFTLVVLAPFCVPLAESKSTYHGISSAGLSNSVTPQTNTGAANSANMLTGNNFNNTNKVIMINFDDAWKSQIQYAKPILDKYGFKASFFIVATMLTLETQVV
jgi:peptidoglycan/xylan/chitin deacetylase (PgdA/CDA1 family)